MPTDNDLCPLCGEAGTTRHHRDLLDEYCMNPDCNLAVSQWPRIRELVAILEDVPSLHQRICVVCSTTSWHADAIEPYVKCRHCGLSDTRKIKP